MQGTRLSSVPALLIVLLVAAGGCGDLFGPGALSCDGGIDISVGETVSGTLQSGDDQDVDGAWLDAYNLGVEDEGSVVIDMMSDDVDAWLWLLSESGSVLAADDDGGSGLNARITQTLERGCYVIEATTYAPNQTGNYTLSVSGS